MTIIIRKWRKSSREEWESYNFWHFYRKLRRKSSLDGAGRSKRQSEQLAACDMVDERGHMTLRHVDTSRDSQVRNATSLCLRPFTHIVHLAQRYRASRVLAINECAPIVWPSPHLRAGNDITVMAFADCLLILLIDKHGNKAEKLINMKWLWAITDTLKFYLPAFKCTILYICSGTRSFLAFILKINVIKIFTVVYLCCSKNILIIFF